jgi:hypothetical protein
MLLPLFVIGAVLVGGPDHDLPGAEHGAQPSDR